MAVKTFGNGIGPFRNQLTQRFNVLRPFAADKKPLTSGIAPTHKSRLMLRLSMINVRKYCIKGVRRALSVLFSWFICVWIWRFGGALATLLPFVVLFFSLVLFCTFCTSRNGTKCYNPVCVDTVLTRELRYMWVSEWEKAVTGLRTLSTRVNRPPWPSEPLRKLPL